MPLYHTKSIYSFSLVSLPGIKKTISISCGILLCAGIVGAKEEKQVKETKPVTKPVRIQDNFYKAIDSEWIKSHEPRADQTQVSNFTLMRDKINKELLSLLDELSKKKTRTPDEQKLLDIYTSFTDMKQRNAAGIGPIQKDLDAIDKLSSVQEVMQLLPTLPRKAYDLPLQFSITIDKKNSSRHIAVVGQSGLGTQKRYYEKKDDDAKKKIQALSDHYQKLLELAKLDHADERVARVLKFESQLAAIQWTDLEKRDEQKSYNIMDYEKLKPLISTFNPDVYLKTLGIPTDIPFNVAQPTYFKKLNDLLPSIDLKTWKDYLRVRLLTNMGSYLGQDFVDAFLDYSKAQGYASKSRPIETQAILFINANASMLLGQQYIKNYFAPKDKERVTKIVTNILATYRKAVTHSKRLEDATRKKALLKLDKMAFDVGYPEHWDDYGSVNTKGDDLIFNYLALAKFQLVRNLAQAKQPVDRAEWMSPPQEINAYYMPPFNKFILQAAILNEPFYSSTGHDSVNYAGIGFIIAHEVGHAFDDTGSQYDEEGNLKNWWTKGDFKKFDVLKKKLVKQADHYELLPGKFSRGEIEIGEIIADLSGSEIALRAYMDLDEQKKRPRKEALQQFFKQVAYTWRENNREAIAKMLIDRGTHPLGEYRTNGTIRNMDGFYEAFDVKKGDGMYIAPEDRVKIW